MKRGATSPPPPPAAPDRESWLKARSLSLALAGIVFAALLLRVVMFDPGSLWIDEFFTLETTAGRGLAHYALPHGVILDNVPRLTDIRTALPAWQIPRGMAADVHPPLYFLLLRGWIALFGEGDNLVRSFSIPWSLGIVALCGVVTWTLNGPRAGLWAAALAAAAGAQVAYAQEARPYAMAVCLLLATAAVLVRMERSGVTRGRLVLLFTLALATVMTHYLTAPVLLAFGVYAAITFRGRERWRVLATFALAAAVFAACWGPTLLKQRQDPAGTSGWLVERVRGHEWLVLERLAVAPLRLIADAPPNGWPAATGAALLLLLTPMVVVLLLRRRPDLRLWALWLAAALLPLAVADLIGSTKMLFHLRYALFAAPAVYALIAAAVPANWSRGWTPHVLPAAALVLALATFRPYDTVRAPWPALGQLVDEEMSPATPMCFYSNGADGSGWYAPTMLLGASHYSKTWPRPAVILTAPADDHLLRALSARAEPAGGDVWLVCLSGETDPRTILPGAAIRQDVVIPFVGRAWRMNVRPRSF